MSKVASQVKSFFLTDFGRNSCLTFMAVCSGTAFGGVVYFNTVGLEKWKETVQLYKHGFPAPVAPKVIARTEEVIHDINMKQRTQQFLQFFTVYGFDVFNAGSTKLRLGALIGLPRNFSYESQADIERGEIIVENQPVEWGSEDGELLQEAILMSDKAQKFAIAREIFMADTHSVYLSATIHSAPIALSYILGVYANEKLHGLQKPRSFRMLLYSLIGTFMFGVWSVSNDLFTKYCERKADKYAAALGKNYAEGGVEFYAKMLQRNIALRSLMGTSGEKQYTAFGNDVEFIRQRHVPFTVRKDNLISALRDYKQTDSSKGNEMLKD